MLDNVMRIFDEMVNYKKEKRESHYFSLKDKIKTFYPNQYSSITEKRHISLLHSRDITRYNHHASRF